MKYWELGHLSHVNKVTTLLAIILDDADFFEIFLLKRSFSAKAKSFVFKISSPQESAPLKGVEKTVDNGKNCRRTFLSRKRTKTYV